MHRIENGVRVELTAEEEAATQAKWDASDAASAKEQITTGYQKERRRTYPSVKEQLDMIYHAMEANEIPRATEWYDIIDGIKTAHPKPTTEVKR